MKRPLVGFSFLGWFPFGEFTACKAWASSKYLTPEMIAPHAVMDDYVHMLQEGESVVDDVIRGACPMQVAVPFLPAMLGCKMRILPDIVMGEEPHLSCDEALEVHLDHQNP